MYVFIWLIHMEITGTKIIQNYHQMVIGQFGNKSWKIQKRLKKTTTSSRRSSYLQKPLCPFISGQCSEKAYRNYNMEIWIGDALEIIIGQNMLSMNFLKIWIYIRVVPWDEGFGCRTITVFFSKDAGKSLNDVSHHKRHKNVHCHSCNRQRRVVVHLGWRGTAWQNNGKHLRNLMHVADQNTLTFRSRTYILKSLRAFLRALLQKDTHGTWTWWLFKLTTIHGFEFHVNVRCCIPISIGFRFTTKGTCVWNISIYEF